MNARRADVVPASSYHMHSERIGCGVSVSRNYYMRNALIIVSRTAAVSSAVPIAKHKIVQFLEAMLQGALERVPRTRSAKIFFGIVLCRKAGGSNFFGR